MPLKELARIYLDLILRASGEKYEIFENAERLALDGKHRIKFDFLIKNYTTGETIGVIVKDWKRPIGINVVLKVERDIEDCGLSYGILIGSVFSGIVESRDWKNLILVDRGLIISYILSNAPSA